MLVSGPDSGHFLPLPPFIPPCVEGPGTEVPLQPTAIAALFRLRGVCGFFLTTELRSPPHVLLGTRVTLYLKLCVKLRALSSIT